MAAAKILVVDDSASMRKSICALLSDADPDYTCHEADNGATALRLAGQIGPDLIISDLNMPMLDGRALLRFVRQNPRLSAIPFILVTTESERDTRIALLEIGVDDYLTKPVDPAELAARVASLLRLRRTALELDRKNRELEASRDREVMSQKAAFAGRLAIGLAHEFNNSVACITSNLTYLAERLGEVAPRVSTADPAQWQQFFDEANEIFVESRVAATRISNTVAELQGMRSSAEVEETGEKTPIGAILDVAVAAVSATLEHAIALEQTIEVEPSVRVNQLEVGEALAHLIRFLARRAEAEMDPAARRVGITVTREAPDAVVRIASPGVALTDEELASLFDPNLVAHGHRVRLSVDLSIGAGYIASSGGTVRVSCRPADGTEFVVRLPEATDDVTG